jgi:peptidyl-prolyl cis-trans isomerase SurA
MKRYNFNAILSSLVLCLLFTSTGIAKSRSTSNPVMVTVNGVKITESQVDKLIKKELKMAMSMSRTPSRAMRHNLMIRAIDEIIEKILVNERVKAKRIVVTKEQIDQEVEKIAKSKNMSVQKFIQTALPTYHLDIVDFKDRVAMGLRFDKLIELVAGPGAFNVSENEAKRYYARHKDQFTRPAMVKASHIMIKYPKNDKSGKADVKDAMGKIAEMAKNGKDFAELAKEYSEDRNTSKKGGDLGFFAKGNMPPKIAAAAFSLKAGEISKVIEMPYGCHLIKVFKLEKGGVSSFEKVKMDIIDWIKGDAKDRFSSKYLDNLRAGARIKWPGGKRPVPMPMDKTGSN